VGFVVEEIPFGGEIVRRRPGPIIGISKGFDTGAKEWVVAPEIESALPDDFANILTRSDIDVL